MEPTIDTSHILILHPYLIEPTGEPQINDANRWQITPEIIITLTDHASLDFAYKNTHKLQHTEVWIFFKSDHQNIAFDGIKMLLQLRYILGRR